MERLTKRDADGQAMMDCQKCEADWTGKHGKPMVDCTALYCRNRLLDRLVKYEDTRLTPDQIESMYMENKELVSFLCTNGEDRAIELVIELVKADVEGRVVILPCKIGDTLFRPLNWRNIVEKCTVSLLTQKTDKSWKLRLTSENFRTTFEITINDIGKTVFLTREEAEKALEEEKDD